MSRISLHLDGATPNEACLFLAAFHRTRHQGLPAPSDAVPTVGTTGAGCTVTTPAMGMERAIEMVGLLSGDPS